jgi:hypothetical protein
MEDKVGLFIPFVSIMIPVISIVLGIAIGMLAIYLNYRKRRELYAHYHQERMAAIEKGMECPPWPTHLLASEDVGSSSSPRRHLLKGLVWLFIGLGLIVAVYATFDLRHSLFGLIPAGIGLAHLIYYFVEGKREAEVAEQAMPAPTP